MAAKTTFEGEVRTNVDHVHCFSCKSTVTIHEVLEAWSDLTERDHCPRCGGDLFAVVVKIP